MAKIDLKKSKQPEVPAIAGKLPLRPGRIVELTEAEQAALEKIDWQAGDPIPGELPDILAAEQARLAAEPNPIMQAPGTSPVIPEPIRIEDLPAGKQAEIADALSLARRQLAAQVTPDEAAVSQDPGINAAYRLARKAAELDAIKSKSPNTATREKDTETDLLDTVSHTGLAGPSGCPHCGWNLKSHPDGLEPDETDKVVFLQSILGGKPFFRTFSLLGGSLSVVFRSLSRHAADLIQTQLHYEMERNEIRTASEYFEAATTYRLCLSIATLRPTNGPVLEFPIETEYDVSPDPKNTSLLTIREYVADKAFPTESLRHVLGLQFARFQQLLAKLEARVDDENFWKKAG